jgi:hypothetical protein
MKKRRRMRKMLKFSRDTIFSSACQQMEQHETKRIFSAAFASMQN